MSRPLAVAALLVVALAVAAAPAQGTPPTGAAPGGPGALSHFDLARKDCVGTARNRGSKVWFTVADGVLSDVYFPTNDTTNNETLQYVVTDGSTFTDLQTRDMTYTVVAPDDRSLSCRVTARDKDGRYKIVTDYVTDTEREAVVMRSRFTALKGKARDYKLYVRFDPTLNGNGGGGTGNGGPDSGAIASAGGHTLLVGSDPVTATNAANRDYAVPVHSALDADRGFLEVSNGFAGGPSDGLTQLDALHRLTGRYATAATGNLVQTARVDLGHDGDFELALGLADSLGGAISAARGSLKERFHDLSRAYDRTWHRYDGDLIAPRRPKGVSPGRWRALVDQYYLSANYVKAAEDKTFPGAVAAALASPWGQAVSAGDPANTYFGSYREVFARDLYEAWTALLVAGDRQTARSMTRFLFERQQLPDGSMPRNSLTNGKPAPDSFNTQLDECAYPLVMALAVGLTGKQYYEDHIKPAANFVATRGPSFGPERWEEQSGFSPSTISAEIAGLIAAAKIAKRNGDAPSARVWRATADEFQRNLKRWTLTTNGPLSPDPYFIRLSKTRRSRTRPSATTPATAAPHRSTNADHRRRLPRVRAPRRARRGRPGPRALARRRRRDDPTHDRHRRGLLPLQRRRLRRRRHGRAPLGALEQGHRPPVARPRRRARPVGARPRRRRRGGRRLEAMHGTAHGVGLIPEQAWELPDLARSPFGTDPTIASIGFENGKAAGSAAALTWSAGQFVRLMRDVSAGRVLDRPRYTTRRYVKNTQEATDLKVTAPADESSVGSASVDVTGTSVAGNRITVAATNIDPDRPGRRCTRRPSAPAARSSSPSR